MQISYITEEAVYTRKSTYKDPGREKEKEILHALQMHFAMVHARVFEKIEGYEDTDLREVSIEEMEIRHSLDGAYFKAVYGSFSDHHVGFAMEALSGQDPTNCFQLRVIMQPEDPANAPWLALKRPEDRCVRFGRELWKNEKPVTETKEDWEGRIICSLQLPDHAVVPAIIADAWKQIEEDYVQNKGVLIEEQIEEYEGDMSGGAFIDLQFKGEQLSDLLTRLQAISDDAKKLGGKWVTEGYLYEGFSILSFVTDDQGKIAANYLAL